jgi:hypothetical protein
MRTTLTLDADVTAGLERLKEARGLSLKAAVNEALRHGLVALEAPSAEPRAPYRIRPWSGGCLFVENLDDVAEALATAEGEEFR